MAVLAVIISTTLVVAAVAAGSGGTTAPGAVSTGAAPPTGGVAVPYQFIAKAYTELLGRGPTGPEWSSAVAYFVRHGCTASSLSSFGTGIVGSREYAADYPRSDPAPIVLTLYRFILNREPGPAGFVTTRDALALGVAPVAEATALFSGAEFTGTTGPAVCNPADPSDFFGEPGDLTGHPAIQTPGSGAPGPDSPEAVLQRRLDEAASGGGTVSLPARQVVGLTTTLVVPGGVTLTTVGGPDPTRYADMARLVRVTGYAGGALVQVGPGARLEHVWVDGQRDAPDPNDPSVFNVRMMGGTGTTVRDDRLGNPYGASNLEADGASSGVGGATACSDNVISDNLVEAYASAHTVPPGQPSSDHPESDGLGIYCHDARVEGNTLVDVSDAGIVLFDGAALGATAPPQLSVVADNTIISAGNSMYWGIVTDPGYSLAAAGHPGGDPAGVTTRRYAAGGHAAEIIGNRIWSGDRTHIDVVLAVGTHALFGSVLHQDCYLPNRAGVAACGGGRNLLGGRWSGNSSAGQLVEVEMGIYVGGADGATVTGNRFPDLVEVTGGSCPKHPVVVVTGNGGSTDFARRLRIDVPFFRDTAAASDICVTPTY